MDNTTKGPIACDQCGRPRQYSNKVKDFKRCVHCQQSRWYEKNKGRVLFDRKKYYEQHGPEIRKCVRSRYYTWCDTTDVPHQKKVNRAAALWRKYRISQEDYERMFREQDGKCFLCDKASPAGRPLCVDHCHKKNKVRKLLCWRCNFSLASIENQSDWLTRAVAYLKEEN